MEDKYDIKNLNLRKTPYVQRFKEKSRISNNSLHDELDLQTYNKAIEEYKQKPVSYPLEDVIKELNL